MSNSDQEIHDVDAEEILNGLAHVDETDREEEAHEQDYIDIVEVIPELITFSDGTGTEEESDDAEQEYLDSVERGVVRVMDLQVVIQNSRRRERLDQQDTLTLDDQNIDEAIDTGTYANLATTHSYLGRLDEVSGYTYYDNGEILKSMPAIFTDTLVFPGHILPLTMEFFGSEREEAMKVTTGYTFVLITFNVSRNQRYKYGVILEVFEASITRNTLNFKAKGRERCVVQYNEHIFAAMWGRFQKVTVKVLVEPIIRSVLQSSQLLSIQKFGGISSSDQGDFDKSYKFRRLHLVQYPFPRWVYDQNDLGFYVRHILAYLEQHYNTKGIPTDPVALSYWCGQNMQLNHSERLQILSCNSALERLRLELKLLRTRRVIRCKTCSCDIANQTSVFCLSKYGMQGNYVNPGGNVFEAITLLAAQNFDLLGTPSSEFSWFPGYAWTIMQCKRCSSHLGWKFTATNSRLSPSEFFAIANGNVYMFIINGEVEDDTSKEESVFLNG